MPFGVFCLEGEWGEELWNKDSVRPLLDILDTTAPSFKFIHRRVATKGEFDHFVNHWTKSKYRDYKVLYLASHGESGVIGLDEESITLEDLQFAIDGRGKGRYIHLGACNVLKTSENNINNFIQETKVDGVIGYTKTVDWIESAAFEMLLFETLRYYEDSAPRWPKQYIQKNYGTLAAKLGFKFFHR